MSEVKQTIAFEALEIEQSLKDSIAAMGFESTTPIQEAAIPPILEGQDLMGCSGTGTGKTAAFAIPLVQQLIREKQKSAMVIVPTRELALQITTVFNELLQYEKRRNLRACLLVGGAPMRRQIDQLRGHPRIIVGTPGRLIDHLNAGRVQPKHFTTLVLDEADRILDMGFEPQLKQVLKHLPKERQSLLFSATFPPKVKKLAETYMVDPLFIDARPAGGDTDARANITQAIRMVSTRNKKDKLLDSINQKEGTVIVFAASRRRTDHIAEYLLGYGLKVGVVHGAKSQAHRNRALKDFRDGKSRILVATDVASRGIDVPHVEHVINYDLPQVAEDYVHRIGRTGRAGKKGDALSLLTADDSAMWREITRFLAKSKMDAPEWPAGKDDVVSGDSKRGRQLDSRNQKDRDSSGRKRTKRPFARTKKKKKKKGTVGGTGRFAKKASVAKGRGRKSRPASR
jgi:ATP-dependent RNA helicase DeaD